MANRCGHCGHESEEELTGWPHEPCEDAPCCGHGGICGRAIGMSIESYEDGFDTRTDAEIKQEVYERMAMEGEW